MPGHRHSSIPTALSNATLIIIMKKTFYMFKRQQIVGFKEANLRYFK